ncbi:MAG: biopolymer transporter ExbD, partial [bacterium]
MAMTLGSNKSVSGRHRSNSEINVTPMVDVMLVLLVIFMITAPTLKEGLAVDIP